MDERSLAVTRRSRSSSGGRPVDHLCVTLDEVNYGVSPGDDAILEPYAYVGPWTPQTGDFWNTSFGAARLLTELTDVLAFFQKGRALVTDPE
jgi:hypothetical protein